MRESSLVLESPNLGKSAGKFTPVELLPGKLGGEEQ